ncbi:MAG: Gfo/Idh/MocA family protein [Chloroflexota bacterium]
MSDPGSGQEPAAPIRVGIIGAGLSGAIHLAALRAAPGFEAVSICARRPERAAAVALETRIPAHTGDFRALCRDPGVDAVIVAAPPHLHHQMAIAALEEGKHVLCEKPMARNVAEARDMLRISERAGTAAMINFQQRFLPIRQRIKALLEERYLGEVHAVTMTIHRSSLNDPMDRPWGWLSEADKAGGMLGASGAHYLDALRWWIGDIRSVAGALATRVPQRRLPDGSGMGKVDADDNFAVILRFASGALGTIHLTATAGFEGDEEITISGERGLLMARGGALFGARAGDPDLHEFALPSERDPGQAYSHYLVGPTARLHQAWERAIRTGEPGEPSFADGVKIQEVMDAVARSGQQGRWSDTSGQRWQLGAHAV